MAFRWTCPQVEMSRRRGGIFGVFWWKPCGVHQTASYSCINFNNNKLCKYTIVYIYIRKNKYICIYEPKHGTHPSNPSKNHVVVFPRKTSLRFTAPYQSTPGLIEGTQHQWIAFQMLFCHLWQRETRRDNKGNMSFFEKQIYRTKRRNQKFNTNCSN